MKAIPQQFLDSQSRWVSRLISQEITENQQRVYNGESDFRRILNEIEISDPNRDELISNLIIDMAILQSDYIRNRVYINNYYDLLENIEKDRLNYGINSINSNKIEIAYGAKSKNMQFLTS